MTNTHREVRGEFRGTRHLNCPSKNAVFSSHKRARRTLQLIENNMYKVEESQRINCFLETVGWFPYRGGLRQEMRLVKLH